MNIPGSFPLPTPTPSPAPHASPSHPPNSTAPETTLGHRVLSYFAGPQLSQLTSTLTAAQNTAQTASRTASEVSSLLSNPGLGLSGQPSIPRGQFTQSLVRFYHDAFNPRDEKDPSRRHHVLCVYDRCARLVSFKGVVRADGGKAAGPTEEWTVIKKVQRGKGRIGLWGFHVWVFEEGEFELLGDGGYQNWAYFSSNCERNGKRVRFLKIN